MVWKNHKFIKLIMTPRLKVLLVFILAPVSFWITFQVVKYFFPQERFADMLAFVIDFPILMWLYMTIISTKKEAKEFDKTYWKMFNWQGRFFGALCLFGGILAIFSALFRHNPILPLSEKIVIFIVALLMILLGIAFLKVKDYQPKKIGDDYDDDNKSEGVIEQKQYNPLSGIYKKED